MSYETNDKLILQIDKKIRNNQKITQEELFCYCINLQPKCRRDCIECALYDFRFNLSEFLYKRDNLGNYDQNLFNLLCQDTILWDSYLQNHHSINDRHLTIVKEEFDFQYKELNKRNTELRETLIFTDYYLDLVLQSMYAYSRIKEEESFLNSSEFYIKVAQKTLLIDTKTFTHIFFRHFGEVMKGYKSKKSFFNPFSFDLHRIFCIIENMIEILVRIENSQQLLSIEQQLRPMHYKIDFVLNNEYYKFYLKENDCDALLHVETFFPLTDIAEIERLNETHDLKIVNSKLDFFVCVKKLPA